MVDILARIAGLSGVAALLTACPMMMARTPHSANVIECRYPGEEFHAALDFNTTCWPESQSRLVLHGKVPEEGKSVVPLVDIQEGPARAFTAQLHHDTCRLTVKDAESGVSCDFLMPLNEGPEACRGPGDAPLDCTASLNPPAKTTR